MTTTVPMTGYPVRMLEEMYPAPLHVDDRGRGGPAVTSYLALPTKEHCRIIVPAGHPRAAARAVQRQLTSRRLRTRLSRMVLTAGLGSGLLDLLHPQRLSVRGDAGEKSLVGQLEEVFGQPVLMSFPVGPERANRKPVLQLTDLSGRALGFAKVGHDVLTRSLVLQETETLRRLAQESFSIVRTPRVLAAQDWNDLTVLVLEPLPITAEPISNAGQRDKLVAAVQDIASISQTTVRWSQSGFRRSLMGQIDSFAAHVAPLRVELDRMDRLDPYLWLGAWHGDLNPGNLAPNAGGVLVWDWERFAEGVPVGFDLLHHDLHKSMTMDHVPADQAALQVIQNAATILAPLSVAAADAPVVARLYLMSLAARYLRDDQTAAGAAVGRVETWLLPALALQHGAADERATRRHGWAGRAAH